MAKIIDSVVNVVINNSISGVTTTGVNTVALVGAASEGKSTKAGSYSDLKAVGKDFGEDSELYAMATKYFAQDRQPGEFVCIPCSGGLSGAKAAIEGAIDAGLDFYHICIANGDEALDDTALKSLQDLAAGNFRFVHVQVPKSKLSASQAKTLMESLKSSGCDRVAVYLHKEGLEVSEGEASGEFLNVAAAAYCCSIDSARGTFAHKKLKGVTGDSYDKTDFDEYKKCGVNMFLNLSGEYRLVFGTACSNEWFIDNKCKDDWIRFNVQSKILQLLGEANDGHGITYDDAGIGAVVSTVLQVFAQAEDTDHQYIMGGYTVTAPDYAYIKNNRPEEIRKRNLPLVKGRYSRMNSVQTVQDVELTVTL